MGIGRAGLRGAGGGTDPGAPERLGLTYARGALPPSGSSVQVELPDPSGLDSGVCDPRKGAREWPVHCCTLPVRAPASQQDTARQVGGSRREGPRGSGWAGKAGRGLRVPLLGPWVHGPSLVPEHLILPLHLLSSHPWDADLSPVRPPHLPNSPHPGQGRVRNMPPPSPTAKPSRLSLAHPLSPAPAARSRHKLIIRMGGGGGRGCLHEAMEAEARAGRWRGFRSGVL